MKVPDYHTHAFYCRHAVGRPQDYVRAAAERGIPEIAFTDHVPVFGGYNPEHRMTPEQWPLYAADVEAARQAGPVGVLRGVEADYHAGCEKYLPAWLAAHPLDVVLGSVHWLDPWAADDALRVPYGQADVDGTWRKYYALMGKLVATGLFDVIAHFDLPKKKGQRPSDDVQREIILPVLDRVAAQGMAIEINASGWFHPVCECYPSPQILAWACERRIPITFGSDAHRPEHVGSESDRAILTAQAAGYRNFARFRERRKTLHPLP